MTMNEIGRPVSFHKLQKFFKSPVGQSLIIVDTKWRCVGYQYVQIAFIFDLIECHSGNHFASLTLHLPFGVKVLSLPVMKCPS
jgi:hypothetical protein